MSDITSLLEDIDDYIQNKKQDKYIKRYDIKFNYKILENPQMVKKDIIRILEKIDEKIKQDELIDDVKYKVRKEFTDTIDEKYIEYLILFIYDNFNWPICEEDIEDLEDSISESDILAISNLIPKPVFNGWRANQLEAINILKENGFKTGIHCHSTGTGKSLIYLHYCQLFLEKEGDIIITTERLNILLDQFYIKVGKEWVINPHNKEVWKENNIIDLDEFKIINFVTKKDKKWYLTMNIPSDKKKIILINRAFLTQKKNYKKIISKIGLIINDECHSCVNKTTYDCFTFLKNKHKMPLIGFSATPIRPGKTNGDRNMTRLKNIFCEKDSDTLSLLSNFNIIYSIQNKWILPPSFHWFYYIKTKNDSLLPLERDIIMKSLNDLMIKMPNRKGVAWCGRVATAKKWFNNFNKFKHKYSNLKNINCYIDHSRKNDCDDGYDEKDSYTSFRRKNKNAIIFCANKHREGSDIPYLDYCIFLDKVKKRSPLVFIQSIGRVLRKSLGKEEGIIIDGYLRSEPKMEAHEICDKIIGYYLNLENEASEGMSAEERNLKYYELISNTMFNPEKGEISMNINGVHMRVHTNELKWENINETFKDVMGNKMKLSLPQIWKEKCKYLKEKHGFENERLNFPEEYDKLDLNTFELPDIRSEEWIEIVRSKTWYEWLDLETEFYEIPNIAVKAIKENNQIDNNKMDREYYLDCCNIDSKLPPYPELWWGIKFTGYNIFHNKSFMNIFM